MSDKSSKAAIDRIRQYLDERAGNDPLFAASYAKEGKNIDECFRYILSEARKRGTSVCMTDEEVFGLAVHYYDEDKIEVPKSAPTAAVATTKAKSGNDQKPAEPKPETKPASKPKKKSGKKEFHEPYVQLSLFD